MDIRFLHDAYTAHHHTLHCWWMVSRFLLPLPCCDVGSSPTAYTRLLPAHFRIPCQYSNSGAAARRTNYPFAILLRDGPAISAVFTIYTTSAATIYCAHTPQLPDTNTPPTYLPHAQRHLYCKTTYGVNAVCRVLHALSCGSLLLRRSHFTARTPPRRA